MRFSHKDVRYLICRNSPGQTSLNLFELTNVLSLSYGHYCLLINDRALKLQTKEQSTKTSLRMSLFQSNYTRS